MHEIATMFTAYWMPISTYELYIQCQMIEAVWDGNLYWLN